ncbi:MAG: tryptophan synthase subunit alpha [Sphingomonas sp.]|nr:tryptophan synthase subunit alpha [Sphingomonas sp.]
MSRYAAMFERLKDRGEGAFGAFLMLGDPDMCVSADLLDALAEAGADMIEVGVPFSDPVADGPVIQAAAERALAAGVRVDDCFQLIAGFRERHADIPVGILTYANLVAARGRRTFMRDAAAAGTDSLLIADLPTLEAEPWVRDMEDAGIEPVMIAAANTPPAALRTVARLSSAYTYCVSRSGITGVHAEAHFDAGLIERVQNAGASPSIFGFGVSRPDHVQAALRAGAAGVISGSAIVALASGDDPRPRVVEFVAAMKAATIGWAA